MDDIGQRMIDERRLEIDVAIRALRMLQAHYGNPYFSFKCVTDAEELEWRKKAKIAIQAE